MDSSKAVEKTIFYAMSKNAFMINVFWDVEPHRPDDGGSKHL
jgi:hypothetical protein